MPAGFRRTLKVDYIFYNIELRIVVCVAQVMQVDKPTWRGVIFHLFLGEVVPVSKICAEEVKRRMRKTNWVATTSGKTSK